MDPPSVSPAAVSQEGTGGVVATPGSSPTSGAEAVQSMQSPPALVGEDLKQPNLVAQPASAPIDRHPEHLHIEERERAFMKTLYDLIPSARAGKRFINIYRLLRASVEDRERRGFIGSDAGG